VSRPFDRFHPPDPVGVERQQKGCNDESVQPDPFLLCSLNDLPQYGRLGCDHPLIRSPVRFGHSECQKNFSAPEVGWAGLFVANHEPQRTTVSCHPNLPPRIPFCVAVSECQNSAFQMSSSTLVTNWVCRPTGMG